MAKKSNDKKKKLGKTGIWLCIWILAMLAIVLLFVVNQNRIFSNLKNTDFFSRTFGKTPTFVENAPIVETDTVEKNDVEPLSSSVEIQITEIPPEDEMEEEVTVIEETKPETKKSESAVEKPAQKKEEAPSKKEESKTEKSVSQESPAVTAPRMMNLKLYFMVINSDGSVSRKEVTRSMKKSDSPLVDAVNALIAGPIPSEAEIGCHSLISAGTRLIGASVRDGVATLNFSGEFEFNQYGVEGTRGQLQQIVYTATAFPTVNSVLFLVEGDRKEYLGSEGVWIGTPITRNMFP